MVTHSYCRNWQSVTSFILQECGISAVHIRTLGQYYNAEKFQFKFMNRIHNSGPNLKATSKTRFPKIPRIIFAPFLYEKIGQKVQNYVSKYGMLNFPDTNTFLWGYTEGKNLEKDNPTHL
jgi:hypothetical protein